MLVGPAGTGHEAWIHYLRGTEILLAGPLSAQHLSVWLQQATVRADAAARAAQGNARSSSRRR